MSSPRIAQPPPRLAHSRHLLVLHLDEGAGGAAALLDAALLRGRLGVGGDVEADEEDEVRGEDADAGDGGELLAGAGAEVGEVWEVGGGEVGPGGEVDEAWEGTVSWREKGVWEKKGGLTEVNDKLNNLHDGDVTLPPDADATG